MLKVPLFRKKFYLFIILQVVFVVGSEGWVSGVDFDNSDDEDAFPVEISHSDDLREEEVMESVEEVGTGSESPVGQPLFLTPLIERAKTDEFVWREMARVANLTDTTSYSGFFTVNKEFNSNLFFWFVPAAYEPETAPLVLWLNGGPGASSLFGLFVENGPVKVNAKGFLEYRQHAWTLTHSIIYIDSPVGTGFSFTKDYRGYSTDQDEIMINLYEALTQFFRIFPEFRSRDFYIAGESYAGKYVPSLGLKIHNENRKKFIRDKINLKGLIIGSGFSDPKSQNEYGEFLHSIGLIDGNQKQQFLDREEIIRKYIEAEDWEEATEEIQSLILGHESRPSFFQNMTGYKFYMNYLHTTTPPEYKTYSAFVKTDPVRKSLHVGNQPFSQSVGTVRQKLSSDIGKSVKPSVEKLLGENYRMLIYAPQLDIIVPHTGIEKYLRSLRWHGSNSYKKAPRRPWRVSGEIAGYTKFARNLAHVVIRNAGHVAPFDQPAWTFDMINRFTRSKPF